MTLQNWLNSGWIKPEKTSPNEIHTLLEKIDRDISTACIDDITADWRLAIAYSLVPNRLTPLKRVVILSQEVFDEQSKTSVHVRVQSGGGASGDHEG